MVYDRPRCTIWNRWDAQNRPQLRGRAEYFIITYIVRLYAPPDSAAATRPDFFKHALWPQLTGNTILGLDANCVPDEALDLKRVANSPYRNDGADELEDICSAHSLIDVAREWLGDLPFFTAHHDRGPRRHPTASDTHRQNMRAGQQTGRHLWSACKSHTTVSSGATLPRRMRAMDS